MVDAELIEVRNLTFYYRDAKKPALDNINLTIKRGEFVGVSGPTGAGKSTLTYCLNGVIPHYQGGKIGGGVYLQGIPLGEISAPQLAAKVGSVFQDPEAQIVAMSVEEEVVFGLENLNYPRLEMEERIAEALEMVGITHLRNRPTNCLSGGQKQRVVIAAVLAMRPEVLVLDEPTSELDPQGTEEIYEILYQLNRRHGITIVLVEQKVDQSAGYLDRLIVMNCGKVLADGDPREVLARRAVSELGIRMPQVSEFALLSNKELKRVPITLVEGLEFIRKTCGKGLF